MFDHIYFCDIETTGLDIFRNDILSLSIIKCSVVSFSIINQIALKFRPNFSYWSDDAEKIHGITKEQAFNHGHTIDNLLEYLEPNKCEHGQILCSHSLFRSYHFDQAFLLQYFTRQGVRFEFFKYFLENRSTITYAKNTQLQVPNYKLNTLCDYFNIELKHHDSESDTFACYQIYKKLKGLNYEYPSGNR